MAIFGYLAAQAVEAIASEVTGDARREKRRRRMIDQLDDHFIICGYGRVGRRAAEEFDASGRAVRRARLQPGRARASARERGVLFLEGSGAEDDDLDARRDRPRQGPARLGRLGRREPLHHALGALAAART